MWKSAVILIWACLVLPAVFALPAISRAKRQRGYTEQELVAAPYGARPPSGPTAVPNRAYGEVPSEQDQQRFSTPRLGPSQASVPPTVLPQRRGNARGSKRFGGVGSSNLQNEVRGVFRGAPESLIGLAVLARTAGDFSSASGRQGRFDDQQPSTFATAPGLQQSYNSASSPGPVVKLQGVPAPNIQSNYNGQGPTSIPIPIPRPNLAPDAGINSNTISALEPAQNYAAPPDPRPNYVQGAAVPSIILPRPTVSPSPVPGPSSLQLERPIASPQRERRPSDRQQAGYRTALKTLSGAARAAQIQRNVAYDGGNQQEFRDQQPEYRNQQEGFRNQEPQFTNQQQEFRDNQLEFINQPTQYRNQQQEYRNQQQELRGNGLESITQQPQYRDQQQQLIEKQPEAYNPAAYMQDPARYEFQWGVKNADGADFGHREARSGDLTEGSYYVLLPDTRTQTVNYRVDGQSGFVADVRYEGQAQYPRGDGETSQYRQREAGRVREVVSVGYRESDERRQPTGNQQFGLQAEAGYQEYTSQDGTGYQTPDQGRNGNQLHGREQNGYQPQSQNGYQPQSNELTNYQSETQELDDYQPRGQEQSGYRPDLQPQSRSPSEAQNQLDYQTQGLKQSGDYQSETPLQQTYQANTSYQPQEQRSGYQPGAPEAAGYHAQNRGQLRYRPPNPLQQSG
ncbi:protein argonaute-2-like [Amphibalanus amphitrite]|uniref:protein argonaute-2-like n=1 Tax=Amphibalanus amphitrite TaxID=1232801 RepID=UPI001C908265|nr:protein argonaute-2-like [Amphibalanus amphitrite]